MDQKRVLVTAKNRFGNLLAPLPLVPLTRRPLISVLVSNYNYGPFLREAIESLLQQTYENYEVIICDDGSTDDSRKVLKSCHSLDSRIRVIYQANEGQSSALNAAFRESTGEIISLMDADDVFRLGKLQSLVDAFFSAPEAGFAIHRMMRVDKARKPLGEIPLLSRLPSGWHGAALKKLKGPKMLPGLPPSSGLSLRRAVADVIFPIPVSLRICSDTLVQILAPMMTPIVAIDELLSEYRIHGDNNGGRTDYGAAHIEKIMFHENEIWNIWRNYVASIPQAVPGNCILPPQSAPSMMEYARARFSGDPSHRHLYRLALRSPRYKAMTAMYRCYWRFSIAMPDYLFRKSFAFVYGQSTLKIKLGRVLRAFRWIKGICSALLARSNRSTRSVRREVRLIARSSKDINNGTIRP
jgi:glycosyltransferase involved in cell wall biosynthesis